MTTSISSKSRIDVRCIINKIICEKKKNEEKFIRIKNISNYKNHETFEKSI